MVTKNTPVTTTSLEKDKHKSLPNNITLTNLNYASKLLVFYNSILGDFYFETFFVDLNVELSHNENSYMQYELLHSSQIVETHRTLVDIILANYSVEPTSPNLWSLYFDSSRSKDEVVVGCLPIDRHGNQA